MPRDPLVYLDDIVTACDRVLDYTKGMDEAGFREDQMAIDAVVRNLEIIGEAAKNVPEAIRTNASHIDWRRLAGLRDVIAHQYFSVNLSTVWDIVQTKLGPLRDATKNLLDELESSS